MAPASTAVKVGAFTVVTVALGAGIYSFVMRQRGGGEGYVVYALMDDATGVATHSQVKIAGIPIGSVDRVSLQGQKARIDIKVKDDVPLYRDASVTKVSSSLLGEYFLRVAAGTEGREKLKEGDQIQVVVEGASTDDILREVREIARDARQVSQSLAKSVGTKQGEEDLKAILHNLAEATDALNRTVRENRQSIHSIVTNVERITARGEPEVQRILENVRQTTEDVRVLVAKSEDPNQDSGEIRQIIERVNRASADLEQTASNLESTTGRIDRGEGTLGRLTKDEKLINEVEGVAEGVNEFVGGLQRIRTIVSLRTDYNYLANSVKSFVELRIAPREDKYYAIELISDPRGSTYIEQIDVTSTNPNDPPQYREVRTVTTNAFRFSLQFAQRMGPFVGRFGIKESTGGVGLDTLLFDDRLEIRQDLFGFGETSLPRYRLFLSYEFVKRFWLLAGVDDLFSDTRRDYFIGLQLRFDDQDLKTILPFVSVP
ncbi:MAG TPA: MlaD family protein [Polyangiaceae bacterium]|nr:MlaD family protein [Polyangiaceae bacterium]